MACPVESLTACMANATLGNLRKNEPFQKKNSFDGTQKLIRANSENYDSLPSSFHKPQNSYRNNDAADREEILECFNKKFAFKPPEFGWSLPAETAMFQHEKWSLPQFMELKEELNEVKNKLNNYNLDDWHKHTRAMNKAGSLLWTVKKNICPEFVTLAWLKFYEICSSYNFVCKKAQEEYELNSVHLCEAPGAFITSLNHYLKLNYPNIKWDWISTTLNPYHEENPLSIMINDDRFILHTLNHWEFGDDYTGNLMDINNMVHMQKRAETMGLVYMVTADGSIDCQDDPGEQEHRVSQLIYCEVVCALHLLAPGGNFVLKMFTMYEEPTICLMYLLACSFESINVYKPATSKEGNSENYVVCLNYVGAEAMKPWLRVLVSHYGRERSEKCMFHSSDIPEDFLEQLHDCAKKFKNYQVEVIERNIYLFETPSNQPSINRTKRLRFALAEEYIQRYKLRPLDSKNDEIVGEEMLKQTETPNMDKRWVEGSFNDKMEREKMTPIQKIRTLFDDVQKMQLNWEYEEDIKWLEFPSYGNKFKVVVGKSVKSVHSSKFCSGRLLNIRNEVQKLAKEHFPHIVLLFSPVDDSRQQSCRNVDQFDRRGNLQSIKKSNFLQYQGGLTPKKDIRATKELSPTVKRIIEKSFSLIESKVTVLNYKEQLWESLESGRNECHESNAFFDLMDEMEEKMWRGYSLIIQGYPMLTQFTAGVIYLMGHLFEKVGFVRPTGQDFAVIFSEYRSRNHTMQNFVKLLDSQMDMLDVESNRSVLSLIPIRELIYGHKEFYSCVTAVNNSCVKEQICDIFQRVTKV